MERMSLVLFVLSALFSLASSATDGGYVITIPRRLTADASTQICVSLTDAARFAEGDSLSVTVTEIEKSKRQLSKTSIPFPKDEINSCQSLTVPSTEEFTLNVDLVGNIAGNSISENVNVTVVQNFPKTFIQTDKYLYRPGQTVQFRILSVKGPDLNVTTDPYDEVYVHTPSRTRIQQWLDVDNSAGLVHLSFDLSDEVEEGFYSIFVKRANRSPEERLFKVEDYVLPRYEVTIDAPKDILGSDPSVTIKLCARYTYGEPVEGNATLSLAAGSWKIYENITQNKPISGCENFTFETNKLRFDDNNCHIRISNLVAYAVVEESGTDVQLHLKKDNINVNRQAILFKDVSPTAITKPYLPLSVKIAATYNSGKPAKNETMEVCTVFEEDEICKNFTTSSEGYLSFVLPSQSTSRIEVRAVKYPQIEKNWNDVMEESKFNKYRYGSEKYLDPANSSLSIYSEEEIQCKTGENIDLQIPVVFISSLSQDLTDVYVQVISRGQVKYLNKTQVKFESTDLPFKDNELLIPLEPVPAGVVRGTFNISLVLPATVSPKLKVLVWYKTSAGVVVADSKELDVSSCLPHKVDLSWSNKKGEPGSAANLLIKGAKNALCSIGVVDKSVQLLSSQNNDFDIKSLLGLTYESEVSRWAINQLNLAYCLKKQNQKTSQSQGSTGNNDTGASGSPTRLLYTSPPFFHRDSDMEAIHMFNNAGFYVLSNLVLETEFCDKLITQALKAEASQGLVPVSLSGIQIHNKVHASPPQAAAGFAGVGLAGPESISADSAPANKEGAADDTQERSHLPETWLWLLQPLSETGESDNPVTLPDTITEWIGKAVCVHPSEGVGISSSASVTTFTPFFVDLTIPATMTRGEVLPLKISIFNYLEEAIPVKVVLKESADYEFFDGGEGGENGMREVCIDSKTKSVQTIKMKFKTLGDVNITVEAYSEPITSGACGSGSLPVKRDRFVRSIPIEAEGYLREKTFTNYICSQDETNTIDTPDTWLIEAPAGIVNGSSRAWVTATGDLMGPTVDNLGALVRWPSGCGEQNMINFAPNIYILQYLDASKQTTESVREKITRFLSQGYQRQMLFRHASDGSFSAFGDKDASGSTWLTAFVVKSFVQAKPYTIIDDDQLLESLTWLQNLQKKDGCFKSVGRVVNKMLEGGISGSEQSEYLLTAYVLAALLESNNITSDMTSSAISCMQKDTSSHPYNLGLRGYALALAKSPDAKTVIDQLIASAASNSSNMRWDISDGKDKNTALHVETAAYALLAMVTQGSPEYTEPARKVVRWISGLRNGQGGFVSTQDTVVALQALAAFEKAQPSPVLNMNVKATAGSLSHDFKVTEDNKFLQQRVDLPNLPVSVQLTPSGQGCAVMQGVLRYNVLADSPSTAFALVLTVTPSTEKDCKTYNIKACTKYTLPDGNSNMAILEVKLLSGYVPIKQDLKDVVGDGKGTFKRHEVDGRKVIFYLDEVNSTEVCASFRAYQEVEIEQPKQGSVSVYDYYQPQFITTEKFIFTPAAGCKA